MKPTLNKNIMKLHIIGYTKPYYRFTEFYRLGKLYYKLLNEEEFLSLSIF